MMENMVILSLKDYEKMKFENETQKRIKFENEETASLNIRLVQENRKLKQSVLEMQIEIHNLATTLEDTYNAIAQTKKGDK